MLVSVNPIQVTAVHHSSARGLPNYLMLLPNYRLMPGKKIASRHSRTFGLCVCLPLCFALSLQYKSLFVSSCRSVAHSMLLKDAVWPLNIVSITELLSLPVPKLEKWSQQGHIFLSCDLSLCYMDIYSSRFHFFECDIIFTTKVEKTALCLKVHTPLWHGYSFIIFTRSCIVFSSSQTSKTLHGDLLMLGVLPCPLMSQLKIQTRPHFY